MTKVDAACGSTKNSTNWVDAAGLADLLAAGAKEHCSTGGSVRLALVAIMFFLMVPIPFLLKYLHRNLFLLCHVYACHSPKTGT
jgi:hypothetical protein